MQSWPLSALLGALGIAILAGADTLPPKLDKVKLESYVRYTEGYTAAVVLKIEDPVPSVYQGYSRVVVHASLNGQIGGDKLYYVSSDGQHFFTGSMWKLGENPFLDTLKRLPHDGPSFGPQTAKVTIIIFSDFQCPYCRAFAKTVRENIPQQYPNDVRVIFEDFPLDKIHLWAHAAAEWAHCITDQKPFVFWTFHDWIFEHQGEIAANGTNLRDKVLAFASDQKLDGGQLKACVDTHVDAGKIAASVAAAQASGLEQTPTSFINGRLIGGNLPWNSFKSVIELEKNRPSDIPGPQ